LFPKRREDLLSNLSRPAFALGLAVLLLLSICFGEPADDLHVDRGLLKFVVGFPSYLHT